MFGNNIAAYLTQLAAAADARVSGIGLLKPERVPDVDWHVVERVDGLRVRVDIGDGSAPNAAAIAAILAADLSDAAFAAREVDRNPERKALRNSVVASITANLAFLSLPTPTPMQQRAHLERLTQQMNAVLRRLVQVD